MSLPPRPVVPSARLRRFAATHLRSRPARAVYAIVAGGPDRPWSTAEVARHSALDVHEVDRVLRRFAAAGIVEAAAGGRGWRYRWVPVLFCSLVCLVRYDATTGRGGEA